MVPADIFACLLEVLVCSQLVWWQTLWLLVLRGLAQLLLLHKALLLAGAAAGAGVAAGAGAAAGAGGQVDITALKWLHIVRDRRYPPNPENFQIWTDEIDSIDPLF